ncbi:serine hydrolase domain-containing protein [Ciceribacter ferrooxidans]|uniref:Class C beta-lactamase-related serine hydrolase n=1 Tax=Ciceribacter ferrooxidans TaxID=2509717 RepID=A0A4Q2T276_9HYPH|nr:serine hydrolase [Ciceribacter ferrooxidans]RYC12071.1 class C beta-lactamase-related serine hydrolase [Ciceribacter ferrooxidans]
MRLVRRIVKGFFLLLATAVAAAVVWLAVAPPALLRVGTGYAAKIVCSNVFVAGRDPDEVLRVDVQAPGHPLLKLVGLDTDREKKRVTARLLGFIAPSSAVYREGLGCASAPDGGGAMAGPIPAPSPGQFAAAPTDVPWPDGEAATPIDPKLGAVLGDATLAGPGMRAVVVIKNGRLVGEAYGNGFSPTTPLLGWSMTKTVNAAIIGRLMSEGRIALDDRALLPEWKGDDRSAIRVRDLFAMESGLAFNEEYGDVTDVTRMLYLEPDMAAFAATRPLAAEPGTVFSYSSGGSVLLSKIWMDRIGDREAALGYPRKALFQPLGMASAVLEADEAGTLVGSSYMYATGRDWARFGQFLLQDGVWKDERLLPEGFVAAMQRPTRASSGTYTEIQAWAVGPGDEPDSRFGLPDDTFWVAGHDGQTITIVPSKKLVVVRLGLTPSKLGYRPQLLVKAIADTLD